MPTPQLRLLRWRTTSNIVWSVIGIFLLLGAAGLIIGRISAALAPFVVAFVFVFLMQGVVAWLSGRGMPRTPAVVLTFVVGFGFVSVLSVVLFPLMGGQLVEFAKAFPDYVVEGERFFEGLQRTYDTTVIPEWVRGVAGSVSDSLSQAFVRFGNGVARGIVGAGSGVATVIIDLFLGAVIAFWVLRDLPKIREELIVLAGDRYEADLENLVVTLVRVVGGYLKGQTVASVVTGALAGAGLAVLGVPFAFVLGLLTALFNYVPYIGPFLSGLIAAVIAAVMVSPFTGILAIAVVVAAQQLTDLFVTPRVMSEQVDLHPTLVIFSLLVGGTVFGFWGMLFAIPVAATGKGLFVYYWERRTKRTLGSEDGALFRVASGDDDEPGSDAPVPDATPGAVLPGDSADSSEPTLESE